MDASNFIPALIGLFAPIVISAIRRPITRVEDRTKRLQYWKTFLELSPLAGGIVDDQAKALCLKELKAADDEAKNLGNKTVGFISSTLAFSLMFVAMGVIERAFRMMLEVWRPQFHGTALEWRAIDQQYGFASLIFQSLAACVSWFWLRWKIRDYVWNKLKPGNGLHFLIAKGDDRISLAWELVSLIFFCMTAWVTMTVIWPPIVKP